MKDKHKHELTVFVVNGSAVLGAIVLKKVMEKLLVIIFDREPPKKPVEDDDTTWSEALGWAALTGAMAGVLKLIIRKGGVERIM
ncbi:MAG: DUF4235 domain-containing protein [Prolixibacteraceae bacterium]